MKQYLLLLALTTMTVLSGCSKDDSENTTPILQLDYTIAATEGSSVTVSFDVNADWETTVEYENSDSGWLTVDPASGKAGKITLKMTAEGNPRTSERRAYVIISYGSDSPCRLTVTQAGEAENADITAAFDPLFAQALEKRGYIADASHIMVRDVKNITNVNVGWGWNSYLQENNSEEADFGNLTSLHGIEYFESLQSLICDNNPLTELDVSKNTMLTFLSCVDNRLTALDVSKNTALTYLECYSNNLTALDASNNTDLTILGLAYNQLSSLDISKNTALQRLDCRSNNLSTLDVSHNLSLERLYCDINNIASLNLSKHTALRELDCSDNNLSALDVSHNLSLESLQCYCNKLSSLNTNNNTMLTYLECSYNLLTTLDISKNMSLTDFICSFNPGNGTIFPVTAWFDNDAVPVYFSTGSWTFNDQTIAIDYRKAA